MEKEYHADENKEIKRLHAIIKQQREHLQDLDVLKADFLNVISHELKSPLTPITAYLDLFLKERLGPITAEQREALEIMIRNSSHLQMLIGDIVDLNKLEAGKIPFAIELVSLKDIIENVVKDYAHIAKQKGISFHINVTLPSIEGDKKRLTQVFANLVNNALKFTSKGEISITAKKRGYRAFIDVRDTGIGIPKYALDNVFDKFYQVDRGATRKYPGTGLGLAICRAIIKAHGGEIWVESVPNQSTTFHILLYYKRMGKPFEAYSEIFQKENSEKNTF